MFLSRFGLKLTYKQIFYHKSYYRTEFDNNYGYSNRKPLKIIFYIKSDDYEVDEVEFDYKEFKNFTKRNKKLNRINGN